MGNNYILDENEVMMLIYEPDMNVFTDEFGSVRPDIFQFITPSQLRLFRQYKGIYLVKDITNSFYVQLTYPDKFEEVEIDNEDIRIWSYAF